MRTALILTGFMRNWKDNIQNIFENIIFPYLPDVYITSYTYSQLYWGEGKVKINPDEIINIYNPKKYIFRDTETCPDFNFKSDKTEKLGREYSIRQLYGWYTHYLALDLFDFNDYDLIIKLRTDISVYNFKLDYSKELVIPSWKYHPGSCSPENSFVDYIAYGNPNCMIGYFKLYEKMKEMYDNNIADISLGETLLKKYLDYYVTTNVFLDSLIDWSLRGGKKASELSEIFPL